MGSLPFKLWSHAVGVSDPRTTSGVAAVLVADFEHLTREWAKFVMAASKGLGVKPDAGSTVKWAVACVSGQVIGVEFGNEVGTLALKSIPGLFPHIFKHMIERGAGDDCAASATTVA
jgi:hypothetical protein